MRVLVGLGALLGIGTMILGFVAMRSDIQLIIAVVGMFSALILIGIGGVLAKLDRHWTGLSELNDRLNTREE